jgi:hypothetical protein
MARVYNNLCIGPDPKDYIIVLLKGCLDTARLIDSASTERGVKGQSIGFALLSSF